MGFKFKPEFIGLAGFLFKVIFPKRARKIDEILSVLQSVATAALFIQPFRKKVEGAFESGTPVKLNIEETAHLNALLNEADDLPRLVQELINMKPGKKPSA